MVLGCAKLLPVPRGGFLMGWHGSPVYLAWRFPPRLLLLSRLWALGRGPFQVRWGRQSAECQKGGWKPSVTYKRRA